MADQKLQIPAGAEWLLDNFYLVQQVIRQVRQDLPKGFYRQLPLVGAPPSVLPRIYVLARALIAASEVHVDPEAVRRFLTQCWFDETACEQGLNCLMEYTKVFDETQGVFQQKPLHNWASHGGDAFRTLATLHHGHAPLALAQGRARYGRSKPPTSWMAS